MVELLIVNLEIDFSLIKSITPGDLHIAWGPFSKAETSDLGLEAFPCACSGIDVDVETLW